MFKRLFIYLLVAAFILNGCDDFKFHTSTNNTEQNGEDPGSDENPNDNNEENPDDNTGDDTGDDSGDTQGATVDFGDMTFPDYGITHEGLAYIWDWSYIPEIIFEVSLENWNSLLQKFDANPHTKEHIECDVTFKKGEDVHKIEGAGIRLRGNTSRRRPEEMFGEAHVKDKADWRHCHFGVNLRKYTKDKAHEIKGIRKMNLRWFKDDACYVREVFCYDLFRRAGIWTAANDIYCRLWIHVEGDAKPAYFGVYGMVEPYDDKYLDKREHLFGNAGGNLWKCSYPAFLDDINANFGEDDNINEYTYELKETDGNYADAEAQLKDFILKLKGKTDASFYTWIKEVCDVELLLKTYAVSVAVGMWDDLWQNGNNYYLYFNSLDLLNYKIFLIPYDYDNTLGTSNLYDPARQDPFKWGQRGLLIERLMKFQDFRLIYKNELKRLVQDQSLMYPETAINRVKKWQSVIKDYVPNDTGEDMKIIDKPASWGSVGNYKLMSTNNNYFIVKAQTINSM